MKDRNGTEVDVLAEIVIKDGKVVVRAPSRPTAGQRIRIKAGWHEAGRAGVFLASLPDEHLNRPWAAVQWDGEDDPTCQKPESIEPEEEK